MNRVLPIAQGYLEAGFSIVPIKADGSKAPAISTWKQLQQRRLTPGELQTHFGNGSAHGVALIHGEISGNSEVLDFDRPGLYEEFAERCDDHGFGELVASLILIETPSGGRHLLYRCEESVEGNQKLARGPDGAVRLETRGTAGYTVAPGSPPACHPEGKQYRKIRGDFRAVPVITAEERRALLTFARTFDEYPEPERIYREPTPPRDSSISGLRPGDDYSARGDVLPVLEAAGWRPVKHHGEGVTLRRPGKADKGISGTWNFNGFRFFRVFTSSTPPFEPDTSYSAFAVYAFLEHNGDFPAAAKALAGQGYGDQTPPAVRRALASAAAKAEEAPLSYSDADAPPVPKERSGNKALADFNPTDAGNAERLIALHGDNLRYVRRLGWRSFNGRHWEAGEEAVLRLARETIRALFDVAAALMKQVKDEPDDKAKADLVAKSADLGKHALRSEQTPKLSAMVRQAASFAEITADPSLFHLKPWVVPFANGVWDHGQWREHRREDYTERLLPVLYDPEADRQEWHALLKRITGDDEEFMLMLQEVAGYAFSGASTLRFLAWLYGPKGTGKSTFAELLQTALGAGGKALDWSLVSGDRSGEELGRAIRGTRAVFLPEAGKKRLDPEILKLLSGSDSLPCRELYQSDSFTVPPTWAVIATSNDPPNMTAYDDALKDRVKALPFVHVLSGEPDKPKPALCFTGGRRLEEVRRDPESPLVRGFVAWAVEGLDRVYRNQEIRRAASAERHTRRFWTDTDPLTPFWAGINAADLRAGMTAEALRGAYLSWCMQEGIKKPLAARAWGDACRSAGLETWRKNNGRGWRIPESGVWIYSGDGLSDTVTDLEPVSENSSNIRPREEGFTEIGKNPSLNPNPSLPPDEAEEDGEDVI